MAPTRLLSWIDPEKIDWVFLSCNPAIFEEIKPPPFKEELIQAVFDPKRVWRMGGPDWLEAV
jgi:hypothetical protein